MSSTVEDTAATVARLRSRGPGRSSLTGVDGRTVQARRFRDLMAAHTAELGHAPTEAEASVIRRVSALEVQLEQLEAAWMTQPPSAAELEAYGRLSNTLRRHLAAIGLGKETATKGSVLDKYLNTKGRSK